MKKISALSLFIICFINCINANEKNFYFSSLEMKDGLSQLSVMTIYQDSRGVMWFGTRNGLNKYDGTEFVVYKHSNTDPYSLSHNHITTLLEDNRGNLWIGTINGLNRMDLTASHVTSYNYEENYPDCPVANLWISDIFCDTKGELWFTTNNGLFRYEPESDRFYPLEKEWEYKHYIVKIKQTQNGEYLIGTSKDGLYVCDADFNILSHYHKENKETPLTDNDVHAIYEDTKGIIWVGSRYNGLNRIDPATGEVRFFTKTAGTLGNDNVRCITEYDGKLIIGTFDGLSILHPETDSLEVYTRFAPEKGGLSNFSIYSLYVDPANTLWVGSYSGGINFTNSVSGRFSFHSPHSPLFAFQGILGVVSQQTNGTVWISSEGSGLIEWDRHTGVFTQHLLEPFSNHRSERSFVKSLLVEDDIIWCGTQRGTLYQFNTQTKNFSLVHDFKREVGIYTIVRASDGVLWVGTTSALYAFYPDGTISDRFLLRDSTHISFPSIRCFKEISRNVFLIGTHHGGLYRYNANWSSVEYFNTQQTGSNYLFADYITDIWVDELGKSWVGTFGGGLCLYDDDRGIRRIYTTEDGLPDDNIYSIVADQNRKLWLSTGKGLSCFDPANELFTNYSSWEEIGVSEFSLKGGFRTLDGNNLLFTGSNGFVIFDPEKLTGNTYQPPVVITSFSVNNRPVIPGDDSGALYVAHEGQSKYIVKYNQNNFSIRYAALNYLYPHQNRYQYRLDGYDTEWNYVGQRNEAFYTNLKPGEYTFRVLGSNNDGIWSDTEATVQIRILFPWWQRWYAILTYIVLFALITYGVVYYFYTRRKLERDLQAKKLEQERQEEEYQSRIRMFTNFSHELRTPLMLILSPLEEILQRVDISRSMKEGLDLVYNNGQRLLLLVNQLMDLRKKHSGKLQLKISQGDLYNFLREMHIAFNQVAYRNNITFNLDVKPEQQDSWFDKSIVEKVTFNLLSNAFKYTTSGESVTLGLSYYTAGALEKEYPVQFRDLFTGQMYILLTVADEGKGISGEDKKYIFNPFYQAKQESDGETAGTGIGLSFVYSMVSLHGGRVWVEDNQPKGTVFKVLLPVDKNAFPPETIQTHKELPASENSVEEPPISSITFTRKYSVVLAEDNHDTRKYLKRALEPYVEVLEAVDGAQAWELIRNHLPDLVISDVMMPEMDGLQLCSHIKEDLTTGHIPVVIITARSMLIHIKEGFSCGADDYIVKPFRLDLLIHRVHNLLESRERLKELYGKKFSLASMGIETTSADDRFMQKFFKVIEDHISNPELNVDLLCREIGIGRANLYRKLKALTELSPIELIRNKRLEMASQMLVETDMNIAEISVYAGFSSQGYFTTCFKSLYGMSPKEYIHSRKN